MKAVSEFGCEKKLTDEHGKELVKQLITFHRSNQPLIIADDRHRAVCGSRIECQFAPARLIASIHKSNIEIWDEILQNTYERKSGAVGRECWPFFTYHPRLRKNALYIVLRSLKLYSFRFAIALELSHTLFYYFTPGLRVFTMLCSSTDAGLIAGSRKNQHVSKFSLTLIARSPSHATLSCIEFIWKSFNSSTCCWYWLLGASARVEVKKKSYYFSKKNSLFKRCKSLVTWAQQKN